MDHRYSTLRQHLNELGYELPLANECVPLVERLLGDLVKTTESLFHYKNVAQAAIEERDQLQLGAEPFKCDNAKLVQECNDLHLTFLHFKEQTDKIQKDLKHQIQVLEKDNSDLNKQIDKLKRISDKASSGYSTRRTTIPSKTSLKHSASSTSSTKVKPASKVDLEMDSNKILCLQQEINELKFDLAKQCDFCEFLKNKLNNRDKEISRLNCLLEGGRPITALNKDCCYKEINCKLTKLTDENIKLMEIKENLEKQLADAITKQHEAMKRALILADKNRELERELKDIDQMALSVEAECNSTLKENIEKVALYQSELNAAENKVHKMEREIIDLKRTKDVLEVDYETLKEEKINLRKIIDNALDDKKRMNDKMNQFQRIEQDLNYEIDRLTQTCTSQKRKIAELEIRLLNDNFEATDDRPKINKSVDMTEHRRCLCKKKISGTSPPRDNCHCLELLKTERNQLKCKCKCLQEELDALKEKKKECPQSYKINESMKHELKQKEERITKLEKDIHSLTREKHELLAKIETVEDVKKWGDNIDSSASLKSAYSRAEKERDLARGDVKRLEEERDSLRKRLKNVTESHVVETSKLQKLLTDSEEKLRQIETERREMMTIQGSRRATINNLEEQIESLTTQLRTTQSELDHIQTLYSQIKTLQDQTDSALADTQGQLTQVEMEYAHAQDRIRELERDRSELDKELSMLKNDVSVLKNNIAKIDVERDNLLIDLDSKTERIASLELQLASKDSKLMSLETISTEMKQKLSLLSDEIAKKDYLINNSNTEISALKKKLEECVKDKATILTENIRLQDEMSRICLEWKATNKDFEIAKREIEDLKTQLQHYVYEVKRAEDLISKKENERAEMLDQFRSLSQEATVLETCNHSLETKALETQGQLTAATNHIQDLENKVEQLNTLNKDYERQITQLTSHIASLEVQVRQSGGINQLTTQELTDLKGLCVKLDEQKDRLKVELQNISEDKSQLELEKERLRGEINRLKEMLDKESKNNGAVENLLAASRQETVEQTILNQELQSEVLRLKNMVEELQTKLASTSQQLDVFQDKALDYSQQLKQLRREIANERFRAHSSDHSSRYPSL